MGTHQPIRKTVTPEIPDKLYFRIGDVARLCEVPTYVLRFWETEFPQLKPNKGGTGQRLYRKRDVELALRIKSLLYDQGYTIPGARQVFKNEATTRSVAPASGSAAEPQAGPQAAAELTPQAPAPEDSGALLRQIARLRDLRAEMAALLDLLQAHSPSPPETPDGNGLPKPEGLRPRLVLEARPAVKLASTPSLAGPRLQLTQRDLFRIPAEAHDEDWPGPPVAS